MAVPGRKLRGSKVSLGSVKDFDQSGVSSSSIGLDQADMTATVSVIHKEQNPSKDDLICLGWEGNFGKLYSAIAHTEHGDIPGKARYPDLCWYPLSGKEEKTNNFSFVARKKGCLSLVWSKFRPVRALKLGKEGGHFVQCLAIADTQWGKIPGKAAPWGEAKHGICWYPYGGKEHTTNSFAWVCEGTGEDEKTLTSTVTLVHQSQNPPINTLICLGLDEANEALYSAVAHTSYGDIPGKAKYPSLCWYPYFGEEYTTDNFSFVAAEKDVVSLVWSKYRPSHALKLGKEGALEQSLAIADTQWGKIPGKAAPWGEAQTGTCWFSYEEREYATTSFSWVCEFDPKDQTFTTGHLIHQNQYPPESNLICIGWQKDVGKLYSAVAHTDYGTIPGKAIHPNRCWYPYFGKEIETDNFSFVATGKDLLSLRWSKKRPSNAFKLGKEGDFEQCLAIADTKWGKIPGKAAPWGRSQDGICWYSYDGKELHTDEFSWVCKGKGEDHKKLTSLVKLTHQKQNPAVDKLICLGFNDDGEKSYSAVAHTDNGDIPGKAKYPNLCWYGYFGKEYSTDNFSFVSVEKDSVSLVWSKYRPSHALKLGNEGGFVQSLAIADTEWGKIPGKAAPWGEAQEGLCWYSHCGKEHSTTKFSWVCEGNMKGA